MTPTPATAAKAPMTASQHQSPKSDIEISQSAKKRLILDVARDKARVRTIVTATHTRQP